jgi:nucleoside-diphosphate-sugar epimerase
MHKVIVTGGNGFIGSSLIEKLATAGIEVHALVNENHQRRGLMPFSRNIASTFCRMEWVLQSI